MILSSIEAACYQRLGWGTSPVADIKTRVDQFINDTLVEVVGDNRCSKLRRLVLAMATVANSQYAVTPQAATRIHSIVDPTNRRNLDEVTTAWIDARDPGRTYTSGTPIAYAIRGYSSPVTAQPSASGQLTILSTSVTDTSGPTVYVEVITAAGYIRTPATVALTGVTPANIGPADTLKVTDFYLSAACVGEIILKDGAGNEIGRIGIGQTRARSTLVEIYPKPSAVVSLNADVDIAITTLANPTDETGIPEEFREVIVHGVRQREYEKREKLDLAGNCERQKNRVKNRLILHCATLTALSDNTRPGFSQLGPYYRSGS